MMQFAYLCDFRGLIYATKTGNVSYGGNYMSVYFDNFKMLAYRNAGSWKLASRVFPLNYPGGCYAMARAIEGDTV